MTLKYATDYELEGIRLITPGSDQILELKPHLIELNIFEDIYNNTMSGKLVVSESIGFISRVGLNGSEFLKIRFSKTNSPADTIDRTFRIFSIEDRVYDIANLFESYTINFCSEEMLISHQYRISKSYPRTKISDIITSLLTDYLMVGDDSNKKQIYVDPTTGLYDFVLPNKRIFETINWLSNYALPDTKDPGADMVFFENYGGYHFHSLQRLFTQPSFATYFYNPKNIEMQEGRKDIQQQIYNVLKFEILNYTDTLGAIRNGTFSNRLISLDVLTRKKTVTDFNYNEYLPKSKSMNGKAVSNNYQNRHGKYLFDSPPKDLESGALRMVTSNANQQTTPWVKDRPGSVSHDIFIEKFLPNRVAQMSLANYNRIRITVPGNSQVSVGMTITFKTFGIAEINSKSKKDLDPYLSGKYLVTAIRHIITNVAYITVIELAKESNAVSYPNIDNSNSTWSSLVDGDQR